MQVSQQPFSPLASGTKLVAVTATSQPVQIQSDNDDSSCVRLFNSGTPGTGPIIFVEFGGSGVTASTTTSMPIPPGTAILVACPEQYVAAIASGAGPTNLYITPGNGVS